MQWVSVLRERGDLELALGERVLERVERVRVGEQPARVGVGVADVVARGQFDAPDPERGDPVERLGQLEAVVQHRHHSDLHCPPSSSKRFDNTP